MRDQRMIVDEAAQMDRVVAALSGPQADPREPVSVHSLPPAQHDAGVRVMQEWVGRQQAHIEPTTQAHKAVRQVLVKCYGLTPREADRVWNWLLPMPRPETADGLEQQVVALIDKARR